MAVRKRVMGARKRVMASHRRYTRANGDALAGSLTYALLVGTAPAVLLLASLAGRSGADGGGDGAGRVVDGLTAALLPAAAAPLAGRLPTAAPHWRPLLALALCWSVVRMARALRTGVRAMCGQNAGSGNPVRDAARDVAGAAVLCLAVTAVAAVVTAGGPGWTVPALWALFAAVLRLAPRRAPGRPRAAAIAGPALAAALACRLLALAAGPYLAATAELHGDLYRGAGPLIGLLVWGSLCARVLLRAASWAATANQPEGAKS
ncbi:YhjD/YihY/BrkB family envelope integrity protein [Streptomyces sp. NBC_01244]|uniref:YhjD/YihY/BrkB family envelope integrity protein n=1 Tax=Streptomyces sp. NBC_01244 TaxID=2903797 RepID=UPI002E14E3EC|nr:YihY/virulence factor BrkB family protein [Streptomyces sp. NBC_01244]